MQASLQKLLTCISFGEEHHSAVKNMIQSLNFLSEFVVANCSTTSCLRFRFVGVAQAVIRQALRQRQLFPPAKLSPRLSHFSEALIKASFDNMSDALLLQVFKQILSFAFAQTIPVRSTVSAMLDFVWKSLSLDVDVLESLSVLDLLCSTFPKIVESRLSYFLVNLRRKEDFISLSRVLRKECYQLLFRPLCICFGFASARKDEDSPCLTDILSAVDIGCFLDMLAAAFVEFCFQSNEKLNLDMFIYLLQVLHNVMNFEDLPSIQRFDHCQCFHQLGCKDPGQVQL